jgi:hypothetical protein
LSNRKNPPSPTPKRHKTTSQRLATTCDCYPDVLCGRRPLCSGAATNVSPKNSPTNSLFYLDFSLKLMLHPTPTLPLVRRRQHTAITRSGGWCRARRCPFSPDLSPLSCIFRFFLTLFFLRPNVPFYVLISFPWGSFPKCIFLKKKKEKLRYTCMAPRL